MQVRLIQLIKCCFKEVDKFATIFAKIIYVKIIDANNNLCYNLKKRGYKYEFWDRGWNVRI